MPASAATPKIHSVRRRSRRAATVLTLAAGTAVSGMIFALPASAHVSVNPGEATQGGFAKLTFRVPNESDTAGTTKLAVTMPTDTPLAFVSVRPVPGWEVDVETSTLPEPVETEDFTLTEAVSMITWTAEAGTRIEPGQFQEFEVSAGPMPEVASITFPSDQTYDDGEVVNWSDPVVDGEEEPEHPAPTLTLVPPESDTASAPEPEGEAVASTSDGSGESGSDTTARMLGGGALLLGAAGLAVAVTGSRRRTTP